jgi:hypothetical protein
MKVNLAAEDHDVKDNYPFGYSYIHFKRNKNKVQQQEKGIDDDGPVTQYNQCAFEPGKRQYLFRTSLVCIVRFEIP